jgi:hypothetical protein
VGPLMPGVSALRLSPVLCWVPSGSRDQNTRSVGRIVIRRFGRRDGLLLRFNPLYKRYTSHNKPREHHAVRKAE